MRALPETAHTDAHLVPADASRVQAITRPDPQLWTLYLFYSVLATIAFPAVILPHYFKYKTLRYRFDDDGVSVSYGLIWRRETYLTYARIQDIHVTRNIFERWLGIGTVQIQTASGSSAATESIVGLTAFEEVRNYLYAHMRGHGGARTRSPMQLPSLMPPPVHTPSSIQQRAANEGGAAPPTLHAGDNALAVDALTGIRDELRAVRALLESQHTNTRDV